MSTYTIPPEERMSREQAEHAMRMFEYPDWKCVAIVDRTADLGTWTLAIAPINDLGAPRQFVASHWLRSWDDDCWRDALQAAYREQEARGVCGSYSDFYHQYALEHPHTFAWEK